MILQAPQRWVACSRYRRQLPNEIKVLEYLLPMYDILKPANGREAKVLVFLGLQP